MAAGDGQGAECQGLHRPREAAKARAGEQRTGAAGQQRRRMARLGNAGLDSAGIGLERFLRY